jgi:SMI1-KNR4 cell-wall
MLTAVCVVATTVACGGESEDERWEDARSRLAALPARDRGAPVAEPEIVTAEARLGRFPEQYRAFVAEFGWVETATMTVLGLGGSVPDFLNVVRETESERDDFEPGLPDGHIAISPDGAGNVYTLRAGSESAVYFRDHETGDADEDSPDFLTWLLERLDAGSETA